MDHDEICREKDNVSHYESQVLTWDNSLRIASRYSNGKEGSRASGFHGGKVVGSFNICDWVKRSDEEQQWISSFPKLDMHHAQILLS